MERINEFDDLEMTLYKDRQKGAKRYANVSLDTAKHGKYASLNCGVPRNSAGTKKFFKRCSHKKARRLNRILLDNSITRKSYDLVINDYSWEWY